MSDNENHNEDSVDIVNFFYEKDDFVETFFKKGAEFTSKLILEMQKLQKDNNAIRIENAELRRHLASDEAIRELLVKIDLLQEEKKRLRNDVIVETTKNNNYASKYEEVEKELDSMASLYVALYQLHSKFEPNEMLGVIEQLLAQFIGIGSFVIYLTRENSNEKILEPVHAYHCKDITENIKWTEGPIGEAASTQIYSTKIKGNNDTPLACIPLVFDGETIGVIAIWGLLEQKEQFEDMDFKFFKLLAVHSASAIVAAGLMSNASGTTDGLEQYQRL